MSLRHRNEVGYLTIVTITNGFSIFPKAEHADSLRRYFKANGISINAKNDAGNDLLEFNRDTSLGLLQSTLCEWQHLYDVSEGKPEDELSRREQI